MLTMLDDFPLHRAALCLQCLPYTSPFIDTDHPLIFHTMGHLHMLYSLLGFPFLVCSLYLTHTLNLALIILHYSSLIGIFLPNRL